MGQKRGYKQTPEHIEKRAASKRRGRFFKCLQCAEQFWRSPSAIKDGNNKFCSRLCYAASLVGIKRSDEYKAAMRGRNYVGNRNPNWKGGVTSENRKQRGSEEFKKWRSSVFKRDHWTCQKCGSRSKANQYVRIEAHHIKPFATFSNLRFVIDNGLTLCKKCHDKEPKGKEVYLIK